MNLRKVINKRIRHAANGLNVLADVDAVIAANTRKRGSTSHVSSRRTTRVVQRGGRTEVFEGETRSEGGTREQG